MRKFFDSDCYTLYCDNMLNLEEDIEPNSIDSIVTDPPYELNFMNKGWDNSGIAFQKDTWKKCFNVLKPGGYLLAFGGSRTFHRIACAIEDAGFEIRDTIMWLYGSGFPKSFNIGLAIDKKNGVESPVVGQNADILKKQAKDLREGHRKIKDSYDLGDENRNNGFTTVSADIKEAQNQWRGWGTCLKPAYEPIIVARKPPIGSLVDNVLCYGVGGINIDECRIPLEENYVYKETNRQNRNGIFAEESAGTGSFINSKNHIASASPDGRFPANIILTYDETDIEEVCSGFPQSKGANSQNNYSNGSIYRGQSLQESSTKLEGFREWYNDDGSAARYFYCAKASKKDRNDGCDELPTKLFGLSNQAKAEINRGNENFSGNEQLATNALNKVQHTKNNHPCVKPTELVQYLIRLVTPNGGTILDPFNGSGSTGKAAMFENKERNKGYKYIGIELDEDYLKISKARIDFAIGTDTTDWKLEEQSDKKKDKNDKHKSLW